MRRILFTLLVVLLSVTEGCGCRKKTDEEILKERIDVTPVHLWLATKIALREDEGSRDVKEARKHLMLIVNGARSQDAAVVHELSAKDTAQLAWALYQLRSLGNDALKKDKRDVPKPVLADLLKLKGELREALQNEHASNLEHALFLVGLTMAKVHPDLQIPVPPELLLYEAWWTDPDDLDLATAGPIARAFKAYVFGMTELCDLSWKSAKEIGEDGEVFDAKKIDHDAKLLGMKDVTFDAKEARELGAAVSGLANGSTALCYMKRKEPEKATPPIRRMLKAADTLGLDTPETQFLRGYVECDDGDPKEGRQLLEKLREHPTTNKRRRAAIEAMLERCGKGKGGVGKVLDRVMLAQVIFELSMDHFERSGGVDALKQTPLAKTILGLTSAVGGAVENAKSTVPSYDSAKQSFKSLFD